MTEQMSREESARIYAELRETKPATAEKEALLQASDEVFARVVARVLKEHAHALKWLADR